MGNKKVMNLFLFILLIAYSIIVFTLTPQFITSAYLFKEFPFIQILILEIFIIAEYWLIIYFFELIRKRFRAIKWINQKIYLTTFLMILFYVLGHISITYAFGQPEDLSLILFNSSMTNQAIGNITCKSEKILLSNAEIKCEINPKLNKEINSRVTFILYDGSRIERNFDNFRFIAPENSYYIFFKIAGIDENGRELDMQVGYPFEFLTKEESLKKNEQYITSLIILLGFVLFSVPSMMNNFNNLTRKMTRHRKNKVNTGFRKSRR